MIPLPFDPLELPMIEAPPGLWRLFRLSVDDASFLRRGFNETSPERRRHFEAVGGMFIAGYNAGLAANDLPAIRAATADAPLALRGFVAEGSAMGVCVRDALSFRRPLLPSLLAAFQDDYVYLAHVGCGWAMARLPWRRSKIASNLDGLLVPLAIDGWGFHDCYFKPVRLSRGAGRAVKRFGGAAAQQSWDQGAGRALWFICGGNLETACGLIGEVSVDRRANLFAGLGLAIAYAGGVAPEALATARSAAGPFARDLAQGCAFALEAHVHAGTADCSAFERAVMLTGLSDERACEAVRRAMPVPLGSQDGSLAESWIAYENWRAKTAENLGHQRENVQ